MTTTNPTPISSNMKIVKFRSEDASRKSVKTKEEIGSERVKAQDITFSDIKKSLTGCARII